MKVVIYILLLLSAFPIGIILKRLCKDEIESWQFRFKIISLTSLLISLVVLYYDFEYKIPVMLSLFFISVTMIFLVWKN